jgi:mRNA-degrading endonuclease RelE of RelBE toxin-antitoxin system
LEYRIEYSDAALEHLSWLTKRQQVMVLSAVKEQLGREPEIRTRNRKPLRPNVLASWELRLGDIRVFYEIRKESLVVDIRAIGTKKGNMLYVAGEVVKL